LLATIWRRQQKGGAAVRELNVLQGFDEAAGWRFEIERERELLNRAVGEAGEDAMSGDEDPVSTGRSDSVADSGAELIDSRQETPSAETAATTPLELSSVPAIRSRGHRAA
jgi:hypothetical protein